MDEDEDRLSNVSTPPGISEPCLVNNRNRIEVIIEDVDDDPPSPKSRRIALMRAAPAIWRKITTALQDNRLMEHESTSPALNTIRPNDQRTLKQVLNVTFLTIGICLLVAIIVVIIYTSVVPEHIPTMAINTTISESSDTITEVFNEDYEDYVE